MLERHEKFFAFMALGGAILSIAILAVFHPIPDGSGSQRIVDAIAGGLLLAFGGASNALFRISNATEQQAIGEATAKAISERGVPVTNTEAEPVPTEPVAKDR